jgi:hypothetical protein
MCLRAWIPAGWMPASDGQWLMLCTANGYVSVAAALDDSSAPPADHGTTLPDALSCPFGSLGASAAPGSHGLLAAAPLADAPDATEGPAPASGRVVTRHARGPPALS